MADDVRLAVQHRCPVDFYGVFFDLPEPEDIIAKAEALLGKEGK